MPDYGTIFAAASLLPAEERLRLIDELWGVPPSPLDEAWQSEIERRSAQLDAGDATTISWEVVRDEALSRAENQRED